MGRHGTFPQPFDVAMAPNGDVYVTAPPLHRVRKYRADGQCVKQWGGGGISSPAGSQFYKCKGFDAGSGGQVYVVDFGNHHGQIFDPEGKFPGIFGKGLLFPKGALDEKASSRI